MSIFYMRSDFARTAAFFSGPGTGKHYNQLKKEITDLIVKLIGKTADLAKLHRPDTQKNMREDLSHAIV